MYIILGATGHIGSVVAQTLLDGSQPVTVVIRNEQKAAQWQQKGASVAVADVNDVDQLRAVFQQGNRLFLLNPPAPPSTDTDRQERQSVHAILAAIDGSGIEKIVAESTYGAQPGDHIGDLGVLYELEEGLARTGIPTSLIRAAYYMSNWDSALATARQEGKVHTLYPPDFVLPMVASQDIGKVGARLLMEPIETTGLQYVEGPERYSSADVARAFGNALGKTVEVVETPREAWKESLQAMGFSPEAAESMAAMTALTLEGPELPLTPIRGRMTLTDYVTALVEKSE
ncbi:NmrA family NAD(P)-binding protein [Larkinella terrae]|uniref:NAD(P)H-binding protein n=1 Tax=Larkinella terrae TaxID=2025311 RepID=A0A7K0EDM7_9BACT|nr:NmrA family NAD(P)-binding protein [Larkinella terrae]MRS59875.1 NAD(P)H-binding protein [Larkinella terrae]